MDIKEAIKNLTPRQREAVMLSLVFSYTQTETAEKMGISRPRVTFLVMSGLEAMKSFLNGENLRIMTEGEKQFLLKYKRKIDI
jgi:DNA-directed RNA polymerase specialized sigma24 family protein